LDETEYHNYFNYWWDRNISIIDETELLKLFQSLMRQNYHKYFNYWWDRIIGNILIIDETDLS
jgi:hypothetical protein